MTEPCYQNTELFLVRHGEPTLRQRLLGSTDLPLSDLGWTQLQKTCRRLETPDLVVSSPLKRCANFAEQFSTQRSLQLIIDKQWQECCFGEWDGLSYQLLYEKFPQHMSAFFENPADNTPPNGEKLKIFDRRIKTALSLLLEQYQNKNIVIFTHAGVIRTLVAWCLNLDYQSCLQFKRFALDYASITHISIAQKIGNDIEPLDKTSLEKASLDNKSLGDFFPLLKVLNLTH